MSGRSTPQSAGIGSPLAVGSALAGGSQLAVRHETMKLAASRLHEGEKHAWEAARREV